MANGLKRLKQLKNRSGNGVGVSMLLLQTSARKKTENYATFFRITWIISNTHNQGAVRVPRDNRVDGGSKGKGPWPVGRSCKTIAGDVNRRWGKNITKGNESE